MQSRNSFFRVDRQEVFADELSALEKELCQQYGRVFMQLHKTVRHMYRRYQNLAKPFFVWHYTKQANRAYENWRALVNDKNRHALWVDVEWKLAYANGLQYTHVTYHSPGYHYPSATKAVLASFLRRKRLGLLKEDLLDFDDSYKPKKE